MLPRKTELRRKAQVATDPDRCPKHMAWVRRVFVCAAWKSGDCEGPNHAHHVRSAATTGTGMRPSDFNVVPLCAHHHEEGHRVGWETFQTKHDVNLAAEARKLAKASPHKPRATE